jgi:hypothetical protein
VSSKRAFRTTILLIILLSSGLATRYFHQDLKFSGSHRPSLELAEASYLPPVSVLKIASLGYPNFVADLVYMRGFAYFINHLFMDRRYAWLDDYVHTVVALDPKMPTLYRWASQNVKLGQYIGVKEVEKSNYYAELGIDAFPDDWRLYMDIGFNYFYELMPKADNLKDEKMYLDKAREYFSVAASLPGNGLDPNFVTHLFLENNDTEMALFHAYSAYMDASDEVRSELLNRIQKYESKEVLDKIRKRDEAWKRDFPFLTLVFFEFLGERQSAKVPLSWDRLGEVYPKSTLPQPGDVGEGEKDVEG